MRCEMKFHMKFDVWCIYLSGKNLKTIFSFSMYLLPFYCYPRNLDYDYYFFNTTATLVKRGENTNTHT
jgi:hypothetical protein